MLLKWIFNCLLFMWVYHALIKPFVIGLTQPEQPRTRPQRPPEPPPAAPSNDPQVIKRRFDENDGEYVDYEEVK